MAQNNKPKASWRETDETFVNPYNFIPLGGEVVRSKPIDGELTGKIRCSLIVKTPLAIPDTTRKTEDKAVREHFRYPFYYIGTDADPRHIIPGSSIRGALRTVFETLTNGCLSANNNNILSSRSSTPRRPAILEKKEGKWVLYNARKKKVFPGTIVGEDTVIREWYDIRKSKKTYFAFTREEAVKCSDLDEAVEDYRSCIEIYRKNAEDDPLYDKNFRLDENKMNPLFYEIVYGKNGQKNIYLSPAQISRSVYRNKLNGLLGSHCSCGERTENDGLLCNACSLFGIIKKRAKKAYSGKVRISDADAGCFVSNGYVTLKELASPKTTAVEFYTERPANAKIWNYDYITKSYDTQKDDRGRTVKIPSRKLADIRVRGRKFYFHSKNSEYSTNEKTKRNSTMELAGEGSRFTFDVYFERISESQLDDLVFAITMGENSENSRLMYKLGHGKPLGLGSVKLLVKEIELRNYNAETGSYEIKRQDAEECISRSNIILSDDMRNMFDIDHVTKVSYPVATDKTSKSKANESAAHQWFMANRTIHGTGTEPNYNYTLPPIAEPKLKAYIKEYVSPDEKKVSYSSGDDGKGGSPLWKKKTEKINRKDRKNGRK